LKKISATSYLFTLSKIPLVYGTYGIKAWGVKEWTERWLGLRLDQVSWVLCKKLQKVGFTIYNFSPFWQFFAIAIQNPQ
jgi:hypothetical protein